MATLGVLGIYGDEAGSGVVSLVVEIKLCLVVVAGKLIGCVGILGVKGAHGDALYESHKEVVIHVGVDGKEGNLRGHCRDLRYVDGTNGHTAVSPVNFYGPPHITANTAKIGGSKKIDVCPAYIRLLPPRKSILPYIECLTLSFPSKTNSTTKRSARPTLGTATMSPCVTTCTTTMTTTTALSASPLMKPFPYTSKQN